MANKYGTLFEKAGRRGGLSTLKRYGKRQMREWGKLGGRPPKRRKKPKK